MQSKLKTIQILLPQSTPTGIQIAELTTGIVQVISVPRTHLEEFFKCPEANCIATYSLFGGDDMTDKPLAYIGQTEDLKQRLDNHDKQKEFWARAVILVSKTQLFTQAHIRWLEWKSIELARKAARFELKNKNVSNKPYVTEVIQAEVEEIFKEGSLLFRILGYPIFEPLIPNIEATNNEKWHLYRRNANAEGTFTGPSMIVHKGSTCSVNVIDGKSGSLIANQRERLIIHGIVENINGVLTFQENYKFESVSGAASFISGGNLNGWVTWKNANGKTLSEVKRDKNNHATH